MTNQRGLLWRGGVAVAVLGTALALGGVGPLPDESAPPAWLQGLAVDVIREIAPTLYWAGAIVLLGVWEVLRWQRRTPESQAARWLRVLVLSFALLFFMLACGRTVLRSWLQVGFAFGLAVTVLAIFGMGLALVVTYLVPVARCWNGGCLEGELPRLEEGIVPSPKMPVWDGITDRRKRERRRDWPPKESNTA